MRSNNPLCFSSSGSRRTRRFFHYVLYLCLVALWCHLTTILSLRLHGLASTVSQIRGILGRRGHSRCCFREVILDLPDLSVASTRCIQEIEDGRLQKWADMPAPAIAIDFWRLVVFRKKGPGATRTVFTGIQTVVNFWLFHNGFSIGIGDTIAVRRL
jgi:Alternative oxidase